MLSTTHIQDGEPLKTTKKVGCVSGDSLSVKWKKHYYCNGTYLGYAKDKSIKGNPVENFIHNGIIPEGMLFVIGDHPDSYDSKYFGFLRKENVKAIAYPIF